MAVTLKMIADHVGLSQSAVSQILNGRGVDYSSQETRARVFAAAKELGYHRKFAYKLLSGDHTGTVAILLTSRREDTEEHIRVLIMQLLQEIAFRNCASYVAVRGDDEYNHDLIKKLLDRGTDCFLSIGALPAAMIEDIRQSGHPAAGFGTPLLDCGVRHNFAPACADILRFFMQSGKSKFRMITHNSSWGRIEGLQFVFPDIPVNELVRKYCLFFHFEDSTDTDKMTEYGYEMTDELFNKEPDTQAVFYHNDYYALGGIRWLCDHGIAIGDEVLVAGVNNILGIRANPFPVSSIAHNISGAVSELLRILNHEPARVTVFQPEAIIRTKKDKFQDLQKNNFQRKDKK